MIGDPLLVVVGSLSGTVSIYKIVQLTINYEREINASFFERDRGVLVPTQDPFVTLYVNPKLL